MPLIGCVFFSDYELQKGLMSKIVLKWIGIFELCKKWRYVKKFHTKKWNVGNKKKVDFYGLIHFLKKLGIRFIIRYAQTLIRHALYRTGGSHSNITDFCLLDNSLSSMRSAVTGNLAELGVAVDVGGPEWWLVLVWELHSLWTHDSHAGVGHVAEVVVEEKTPESNLPACSDSSGTQAEVDPVPAPNGEVSRETHICLCFI